MIVGSASLLVSSMMEACFFIALGLLGSEMVIVDSASLFSCGFEACFFIILGLLGFATIIGDSPSLLCCVFEACLFSVLGPLGSGIIPSATQVESFDLLVADFGVEGVEDKDEEVVPNSHSCSNVAAVEVAVGEGNGEEDCEVEGMVFGESIEVGTSRDLQSSVFQTEGTLVGERL